MQNFHGLFDIGRGLHIPYTTSPMHDNQKIIGRVRKLLALGTSPNEAEAALAIEKAHKLLAAYNLELSDLGTSADDISEEVWDQGLRTRKWKSALLASIATAHFCTLLVRRTRTAQSTLTLASYSLVGKAHNIATARLMAEYLFETIERLANQYEVHDRRARESYRQGLAMKLGDRMATFLRDDVNPASPIRALVISEQSKVTAYLDMLGSVKSRRIRQTVNDQQSFRQGTIDAEAVSLNKQTGGPGRGLPALPGKGL